MSERASRDSRASGVHVGVVRGSRCIKAKCKISLAVRLAAPGCQAAMCDESCDHLDPTARRSICCRFPFRLCLRISSAAPAFAATECPVVTVADGCNVSSRRTGRVATRRTCSPRSERGVWETAVADPTTRCTRYSACANGDVCAFARRLGPCQPLPVVLVRTLALKI